MRASRCRCTPSAIRTGVKVQGGIFEVVEREVEIECLPADIPSEFRADVSGLALNQALRAGEIPMDAEKMKLITDKDRVIAHVVTLKVEEEKPAEVAADAATPAEPEVIKKGKKEEEGEEGAESAKGGEKAAGYGRQEKVSFCFALAISRVRDGFVEATLRRHVCTSTDSASFSFAAEREQGYAAHCWSRESRPGISVDAAQPGFHGGGRTRGARFNSRGASRRCKALVGRGKLAGEEILLAKPQTYMNLSGVSIRELLAKYELEPADLLVMWDEVSAAAGTFKIHSRWQRREP